MRARARACACVLVQLSVCVSLKFPTHLTYMYFGIMPHNFPNFPIVYAQKQRERRYTQKHSDL